MNDARRAGALVPAYGRWPLLFALVFQCAVYWGARALTAGQPCRNMTTALDSAVPLLPWTVLIYAGAYIFWAANYILAVRQGEENGFRLLAADALGKCVCFAVFLLLPSTIDRPAVPEGIPFGWALQLLYAADAPDILFPSLHCFTSWLCWSALRGRKTVPAWYRIFSLAFALAVAVSTMTTKQHVLADVIVGIALAELCWQLAGRTRLVIWYRRIWRRPGTAD